MPPLIVIEELDDPRLADYRRLRDVQLRTSLEAEHGLFIAEGEKVIARAVEADHQVRSFLMARRWVPGLADRIEASGAPCSVLPEDQIEQVTGFHVHRGALPSIQRPPPRTVEQVVGEASRVVVLEDVVDHTNVGAVFRSVAAVGVDAVLVTPRPSEPLYRRAIRMSMGTVFQVPWTRIECWPESISTLKEAGFVVAGMALAEGTTTLDELVAEDHAKLVFVFGTEGHGLTPAAGRRLDRRVTIPMMGGVDSLNVAAASAVTFYATR